MSGGFNVRAVAAEIVSSSDRTTRMFPRDVEFAVLSLPVHVQLMEDLTPSKVDAWLHRYLNWSPQLLSTIGGCGAVWSRIAAAP
jgi:hypothetical protein